jgi:hypothetical protein
MDPGCTCDSGRFNLLITLGSYMTQEGDVVLVNMDNAPVFFARIESITEDVKPEWFHVKLLVLKIPLLTITWILREPYINGTEFTMGGRPMRIEQVVAPEDEVEVPPAEEKDAPPVPGKKKTAVQTETSGKVVSMFDRRRKDHSS